MAERSLNTRRCPSCAGTAYQTAATRKGTPVHTCPTCDRNDTTLIVTAAGPIETLHDLNDGTWIVRTSQGHLLVEAPAGDHEKAEQAARQQLQDED